MATIVEYSYDRPIRNSYPRMIVSPPFPSPCCQSRMVRIGDVQEEGNGKFYYRRCTSCGFTVREFLPAFHLDGVLSQGVSDWDRMPHWMERIQRRDSSELAA